MYGLMNRSSRPASSPMATVLLVPSVISAIRVWPCLSRPLARVALLRYGVAIEKPVADAGGVDVGVTGRAVVGVTVAEAERLRGDVVRVGAVTSCRWRGRPTGRGTR